MITNRLYYDDSYATDFTARVIERSHVNGQPALVLDRTYFYPTGGGQPNDTGKINGVEILDVFTRDSDHQIVHVLGVEVHGEVVTCGINWARRFDHMQHHTGQHLLTQAFVEVAGASTIGFHLSPNSVTIDLDNSVIESETIDSVEILANRIVQANRPVTARIVEPDEAATLGARIRRIPEHLATGGLRVIEIADFDLTACGGTHVAHTGEIGLIKILKVEKHKEGVRVEFVCGGRALMDYREKQTVISALAGALTAGVVDLPKAVERLHHALKTAQSELKRAQASLIDLESQSLLAGITGQDDIRIVCQVYEGWDAGEVRMLASKLVEQPGVVALLGASGEKAQLFCACSANLPFDMSAVLKHMLSTLGDARGGGRPEFAQGGGIPATVEQLRIALNAASQTLVAPPTQKVG